MTARALAATARSGRCRASRDTGRLNCPGRKRGSWSGGPVDSAALRECAMLEIPA